MAKSRREIILCAVDDLAGAFLYYDRKEDEELQCGAIEEAILAKEITPEEIVQAFEGALRKGLKPE